MCVCVCVCECARAHRYLWKSKSAGVHDYLCNRLYSLPPERLEPYLVELVRLATMWPGSSLERCVVDLCRRSLRIALKIRWLLVASAESSPHVLTVIQACSEASTKAKWPAPFRNLSLPPNLIEHISVSYDDTDADSTSNGNSAGRWNGEEGMAADVAGEGDDSSEEGHTYEDERERDSAQERSIFQRLWWSSSSLDLRSSFEEKEDDGEGDDEQRRRAESEDAGTPGGNSYGNGDVKTMVSSENGFANGTHREARDHDGGGFDGDENSTENMHANGDDGAEHDLMNGAIENRPDRVHSGSLRDRSASCLMRQDTFRATIDFIFALCETSSELAAIADRDWRKTVLRAAIEQLNEELAVTEITTGPAYPMGQIARVIRIVEDEAVLLNSRDRAPLLLYMEVLEVPEEPETAAAADHVRSPKDIARTNVGAESPISHHQRNYSWSPSVNTLNGNASLPVDIDAQLGRTPLPPTLSCDISYATAASLEKRSRGMGDWRPEPSTAASLDEPATPVESVTDYHSSYPNSPEVGGGMCMPSLDRDHVSRRIDASVARQNACSSGGAAGPPNRVQVKLHVRKVEGSRFHFFGSAEHKVEVQLKVLGHHRISSDEALLNMAKQHKKPVPGPPKGRPLSPPRVVSTPGRDRSLSLWSEQAAAEAALRKQAQSVFGERFAEKREKVRQASKYGSMKNWSLRAIIVKSGDDCRQESLATQLIGHFQAIFKESNLPLWLQNYEILVISARSALIEVIPDALSIDAIKKRFPGKTLNEFFCHKFGRGTEEYKAAQKNFVESLAAYSIVTYLLQIKDRHNGNLMLDDTGHIIHIDFGFMLSNSPGGVNFETAPFKLTRELLEVMGSDADGVGSEPFDYFKVLVVQGFLAVRKHADRVILLIEMMQGVGCPCFRGGQRVLQGLRRRFQLSLTEERTIEHVLGLIGESLDNWRTRQYDYYQRVLNGIL